MRNTILYTVALLFMSFVITAQTEKELKEKEKMSTQTVKASQTKKDSKQTETEITNTSVPVKVKNDIYMVQGKGGNIGLSFGNDGVFIIDDQFEEDVPELLKNIKKISKKPIKYLVNTHHHPDHTGGNTLLANEGATIFSHDNTRKRLNEQRKSSTDKVGSEMLPVITFSENINFYFNNEEIMIFHVHNAHTDGDVIVYFTKNNVIHAGDTFFNGKYPFIDLESGGSVQGSLDALDQILMISDEKTKIIPGHGDIATATDVKLAKMLITYLQNRIKLLYIDGKTLEEVLAMKNLTEKYDAKGYGDGFIDSEKMVRIIFKDVEKERSSVDTRSMEERLEEQQRELEKKGNKKIKG